MINFTAKPILVLFSLLFTLTSFGQSKTEFLKELYGRFYDEKFEDVIELSQMLEEKHPKETRHLYQKTIALGFVTRDAKYVNQLVGEFAEKEGKKDRLFNYWVGKLHLSRYELDQAKARLEAFKELGAYKSEELDREVISMLALIDRVKPYYDNPEDYEIEHLSATVNTKLDEFSPMFYNDNNSLIFTSNRQAKEDKSQFQVFQGNKSGDWRQPVALSDLGVLNANYSKVDLAESQMHLYAYQNDQLVSSQYNSEWGRPRTVSGFSEKIASDFFINEEENLILFVAGNNQKDIYQSRLENGKWGTAKPVSGKVNAAGSNEQSPFLTADGKTLYFSSNRKEALSGYDIFKSNWDEANKEWSEPENMGFPINTLDDETNFALSPGGYSGSFSSNRLNSFGGYDLYFFNSTDKIPVRGTVTDANTGQPMSGIQVKFHPKNYDDEAFIATTEADGSYEVGVLVNTDFRVEAYVGITKAYEGTFKGYVPTTEDFLAYDLKIRKPSKVATKEDYVASYEGDKEESSSVPIEMLGNKYRTGSKAVTNNVYFNPLSYRLKAESIPTLKLIYNTLKKYPNLKIEIAGHTDSIGPADENVVLSKKRAEAVKAYLVKMGISPDRMQTKGYGEAFPLASNDDEVDGRELNRRIEIIKIE